MSRERQEILSTLKRDKQTETERERELVCVCVCVLERERGRGEKEREKGRTDLSGTDKPKNKHISGKDLRYA